MRQGFLHILRSGFGRLSQRDVMKLRPHPGTTILFCAIKENPRRKNCRSCFELMSASLRGLVRRVAR
ncbi:hypothetical protein CIC12_29345 [Burkholderia sp. SG-MS1]|nr:hypothetical protein [Paraburkholderia sp. SG-MS1]